MKGARFNIHLVVVVLSVRSNDKTENFVEYQGQTQLQIDFARGAAEAQGVDGSDGFWLQDEKGNEKPG
jgi:hypothetical protein